MMLSLIDRFRKVGFSFVLLGFSAFASNVCPECERIYSSISDSIGEVDGLLHTSASESSLIRSTLVMAQNEINSAQSQVTDVNVASYLARSQQSLDNLSQRLSFLDSSVSQARQRVAYAQGLLESFSCTCTTSNGCNCAEYLSDISDLVYSIWDLTQNSISPMLYSLWSLVADFKDSFDDGLDWLKNRLDRFDDDYYTDLRAFHTSVYNRLRDFDRLTDPGNLFSSSFPGTTPSYSMGNELLALTFISGTSTMSAISAYDSALSLRYIASNLNFRSGTELQFISNYLDTVQRRYFALFNNTALNAAVDKDKDPFKDVLYFKIYTNFWNRTYSKWADYQPFRTYRSNFTNWFDRIEFALYSIAGLFHSPQISELDALTESTSVDSMIGSFTNSLDLADLSSYSNTVGHLIDRFTDTVNHLSFEKSDEDVGFTIMPSFTFGGISFNEIILPYQTIAPITDFVRSAFRVVWYAIFLFLGFILISRVIRLFIQTVAHVILVVKTLL